MAEATTPSIEEQRSRLAAGVYGTVLVLAVLSYMSEVDDLGKLDVFAAMVGTGLAYFAAHVYVDYLAARMTGARESTVALSRKVLYEEWPLLHAMLAPGIPLLLGGLGVFSRSTAVDLGLLVAFADLVGYGFEAGRRSYGHWAGGLASASVAVVLGAVVIALKGLLH